MTTRHLEVLPISKARIELSTILNNFSEDKSSNPVYLGAHRKAEAVLVSISQWEAILEEIEDLAAFALASERVNSGEQSLPIENLLKKFGLSVPKNK